MELSVEAYARQAKQLFPRGRLFRFESTSLLAKFMLGLMDEFARIDKRARDLLNEWDPRSAVEMLAEWERVVGLPDTDTPATTVTTERQANVTRKWTFRGGQTPAFYVALAAAMGYTIAVVNTTANNWRVDVSQPYAVSTTVFRAGSRAGTRLYVRGNTQLEAVITRWKPAHTIVAFNYL